VGCSAPWLDLRALAAGKWGKTGRVGEKMGEENGRATEMETGHWTEGREGKGQKGKEGRPSPLGPFLATS